MLLNLSRVGAFGRRGAPSGPIVSRPKVWIDNDFGTWVSGVSSSDPDNQQLLPFIALAAAEMEILGISCSTSDQTGYNLKTTVQGFFTDIYGADYDNLVADDARFPLPADLAAKVWLNRTTATPSAGYGAATEASTALIAAAHTCSPGDPLWVLNGASPGTLCQALHDDITILPKLFVYNVGWNDTLYNYTADVNASNYLKARMMPGQAFDELRLINNGQGYYGVMPGGNPFTPDREFPLRYAMGHGAIGDFLQDTCIDTFQPSHNIMGLKAGDACMIFYVLSNVIRNGTGLDPTQPGWGGRYQRNLTRGDNYWENITSGEAVNGKAGANTLYIWRDDWLEWFAGRLQACCEVAPEAFAIESLQDLGSTDSDITGRPLDPGPGVWANYRDAADRDMTAVYVSGGQAYIRGADANPGFFFIDDVPMPDHGSYEVEMVVRYTSVSVAGGGPILALTGTLASGDHFDDYLFSSTQHTVSKERNASATNNTAAIATFPLTVNKFFRKRFRREDNGDGTFTYTAWARNQYGAWVLIKTVDDTTTVFTAPGLVGIRATQTFQCYGLTARTIPDRPLPIPTVPTAPVLTSTPGDSEVDLDWTTPYSGGSPLIDYKLHRSTTPGFTAGGGNLLATITVGTNTYNDATAVNGTTYYYQVLARNGIGVSLPSNEEDAAPLGAVAYTAWPGKGWFDASDSTTRTPSTGAIATFANKRSGGGDLTYGGAAGKITSVSAGRNGLDILRLVRDISSNANIPRLASVKTSLLSQQVQGDDKAYTAIWVGMPTDTNTGGLFSFSRSAGASTYENVAVVRRNATASSAYKQPTASGITMNFGSGIAANTPIIIVARWNGTTFDLWQNSLTKTINGAACDTPAISTDVVFRLFAYCQASATDPTFLLAQSSLDFFEFADSNDARPDADVHLAIQTLATKWNIALV